MLCPASWHRACPPPFGFWLQVLFLHNSLEPQYFNTSLHYLHTSLRYLNRPTIQSWRAASPRQQLLISDEDHTRLPDSCHILKDGHGFTLGCGWVCKTSCQPRGTNSLRHIFVCAKENILWPPGRVVLHVEPYRPFLNLYLMEAGSNKSNVKKTQVPNFPGPSMIVSSANSLTLRYTTSKDAAVVPGQGFKVGLHYFTY